MLFRAAVLGLAAAATAAGLTPRDPSRHCAVDHERGPAKLEPEEAAIGGRAAGSKPEIKVDVYFHVVAASKNKDDGYVTDESLSKQIEVLNDDYSKAYIKFTHKDTSRTVKSEWAYDEGEMPMKRKLRQGDYRALNIYYITEPSKKALGYSTYPQRNATEGTDDFYEDGCVILAGTVPGGNEDGYNLGRTTTHEVGHWFGLFHTFQGGCEGEGDRVDDTAPQADATQGCPEKAPNSCPNQEGVDNVHNFMDYAFDSCMEEFTAGQIERMRKLWFQVRDKAA